jgi:hypothetical protein
MKTITETFRIPSYLACYIANDDTSNLTDDETQEYHDFLDKIKSDNFELKHIALDEILGFYHSNDINNIGCECIELIAFYKEEKR